MSTDLPIELVIEIIEYLPACDIMRLFTIRAIAHNFVNIRVEHVIEALNNGDIKLLNLWRSDHYRYFGHLNYESCVDLAPRIKIDCDLMVHFATILANSCDKITINCDFSYEKVTKIAECVKLCQKDKSFLHVFELNNNIDDDNLEAIIAIYRNNKMYSRCLNFNNTTRWRIVTPDMIKRFDFSMPNDFYTRCGYVGFSYYDINLSTDLKYILRNNRDIILKKLRYKLHTVECWLPHISPSDVALMPSEHVPTKYFMETSLFKTYPKHMQVYVANHGSNMRLLNFLFDNNLTEFYESIPMFTKIKLAKLGKHLTLRHAKFIKFIKSRYLIDRKDDIAILGEANCKYFDSL